MLRDNSVGARSERGREVHTGAVLDSRLVGYWSDADLYQGSMEAADIAFRPDGIGWAHWSRDGGGFFVLRFSWHTGGGQRLTLRLRQKLSGTWDLDGSSVRHHVTSQDALDEHFAATYQTSPGRNLYGEPATLLRLDKALRPGTIGDKFALRRPLSDDERDPVSDEPSKPPSTA